MGQAKQGSKSDRVMVSGTYSQSQSATRMKLRTDWRAMKRASRARSSQLARELMGDVLRDGQMSMGYGAMLTNSPIVKCLPCNIGLAKHGVNTFDGMNA